jgi:L-seryl-tRNA(Ser) seleniumtransferase
MPNFRDIPSVDAVLQRPALRVAAEEFGHVAAAEAVRAAAHAWREQRTADDRAGAASGDIVVWIERRALQTLDETAGPSLRAVINATGVIIHTNLGRAPLAAEAVERVTSIAQGYMNLEFDLASGVRGDRHIHVERQLCALTGAEAALVVNNNAAAVLLILAALAAGREVAVSRGELVEIGGGFRVPDVLAQSGATLREVGTTNRTRVADYAAAISDRTAAILRVHPSNFRIEGFTERARLGDLAQLAHRFSLPLIDDLGSGWLGLEEHPALRDEPSVISSVREGADVVAFSGDKLLGGPQAGLVLGRRTWIDRLRRHPLVRALRADKLTYAALEGTLALWMRPAARQRIPVYRMLTATADDIGRRAEHLRARLVSKSDTVRCEIIDGESTIGGGSAPGSRLATRLLAVDVQGLAADRFEARLRAAIPPVVARINEDRVVLDLRTVDLRQEATLAVAVESACLVRSD